MVKRIPQAVDDHGVNQGALVHTGTPAGGRDGVGGSGHVLGAAGHDDVGVAAQNGAGTFNDGLHTGTADHGNSVGGHFLRNTGLDGDLAGHILAKTCGEHAAEHDLIDRLRLHTGAAERLFDNDCTHLGSGDILQAAAERTNSGTAAVYNVQILHLKPPKI